MPNTAKKTLKMAFIINITLIPGAIAQDIGAADTSTMPYGQTRGSYAQPFSTAKRDPQSTRIVINGRIIDAGDSQTSPNSSASNYNAGVSSQGSTLRSSTLNSVSIGNNIEITGVSNSVININQRNYGTQISNINAR